LDKQLRRLYRESSSFDKTQERLSSWSTIIAPTWPWYVVSFTQKFSSKRPYARIALSSIKGMKVVNFVDTSLSSLAYLQFYVRKHEHRKSFLLNSEARVLSSDQFIIRLLELKNKVCRYYKNIVLQYIVTCRPDTR
jgi:hypothetical protein